MKMTLILLIIFVSEIIKANGQQPTSVDIDYYFSPKASCNGSFHADYDLLFEMHIIDIQNSTLYQILSTDNNLKQSFLYWLHSRLYWLIDSSFLYDTDKYTLSLWNEYCLYLLSISNDNNNHKRSITLYIDIFISQSEIQQIITTELQKNGEEIAAYVRHKLIDYINNHYVDHEMATNRYLLNDVSINLMLISVITTTTTTTTNTSTANNTLYVLIICVCMIIIGFITVSLFIYKRVQKSIKDIKSLIFIGYKFKAQNYESKPMSFSQSSNALPDSPDSPDSPDIPVMDNNVFNKPLPSIMQKAPSTDSIIKHSNLLPPKKLSLSKCKEATKSSKDLYGSRSTDTCTIEGSTRTRRKSRALKYDYNGNVAQSKMINITSNYKQITLKQRRQRQLQRTIIHQQNIDIDSMEVIHEHKESTISYDDNAELSNFKIIHQDELSDSLFNDVVIE